jgi:hypothetical protein
MRGEIRNTYKILVGKHGRKKSLGRPQQRWEGNIRIDLGEMGWEDVDWIYLAQDRDQWRDLVDTVTNFCYHKRRGIS